MGREVIRKIKSESGSLFKRQLISFIFAISTITLKIFLITDMQKLIDGIIKKTDIKSLLISFFIKLAIYFFMSLIDQYFFRTLMAFGSNRVLTSLYSSLLFKDINYFTGKTTGSLVSLLTNDGREIAEWISTGWLIRLIQIFSLTFTVYMMIKYNLLLTLIILFLITIVFFIINIIAKKQAEVSVKRFKIQGDINQFLIESIQSIYLIKPLRKEKYFYGNFRNIVEEEKFKLDKEHSILLGLFVSMNSLLILILPLVSVGIGSFLASKGLMSIGSILSVYALTSQLQEPVSVLADSMNQEKTVMELARRLEEIVVEDSREDGRIKIDGFESLHIEIENYSYGDKVLLKDVNFDIRPNEIFIIKGESGSGKSTLANLILGFMNVENGLIEINDKNVMDIDKNSLWEHILMQDQESLIMEGSLYENLSLGDDFSEEEIDQIIGIVVLDDFVEEYGLNRNLEEGGKNLSGGQKQRINLARILLRKPDVLILDEPTSALDNDTSRILVKNIIEYSKENNITLIISSHRDDFDKYADSRYVID